ncbi:uncharacterized protein METZ01_LOCUS400767, partial [marine metagenome]
GGWGSSNRQWIDLQITAQIFEPTNESIILGDTVTVAFKGGNNGDESANDVIIKSYTNETNISSLSFSSIPQNNEEIIFFKWTPEYIGLNSLNITISCNCTDQNQTNNNLTLSILTTIYRLETTFENNITNVNMTRTLTKTIIIQNNGDLIDNVTLVPSNGAINLHLTFTPNNFILYPGESKSVTINAIIPISIDDGLYNLSFKVESEHNYVITKNLLNRGVDEYVDWRWINSTGSEELYNNTNWTKLGFNDTEWKDGSTPFGDDDLGGIDYRTFWDGDNYGYF